MNKREWLARCEMVYDLNFHEVMHIGYQFAEATERYLGDQFDIYDDIIKDQRSRMKGKTLAQDKDGYNALQALSILSKSCQKCATNPDAWHMRGCMFGCEITGERAWCGKCSTPYVRKAKKGVVSWKQVCKCKE